MTIPSWLLVVILVVTGALGGCASITNSKNQPISVVAVCDGNAINGASCTLSNDKGAWFTPTPGSLMVQKSSGDMVVSCRKDQATGSITFPSRANASVWGNILVGGIIGYAIDAGSGSGFDYPTNVTVFMQGPCSVGIQPTMAPPPQPLPVPTAGQTQQPIAIPSPSPAPQPMPAQAQPQQVAPIQQLQSQPQPNSPAPTAYQPPQQVPYQQPAPHQQQVPYQQPAYQQAAPYQQYPAPVVPPKASPKPQAPKADNWYLY